MKKFIFLLLFVLSFTYAQNIRELKNLANNNDPTAQYQLAQLYEKGVKGVPKDLRKARELYIKAANNGVIDAMFKAGIACEYGIGGREDLRKAKKFYKDACKKKHKPACDRLNNL